MNEPDAVNRVFNFSPGPCTLPLPVLREAQAEFVDYQGAGMSLIEMSHRGRHFTEVYEKARDLAFKTLQCPTDFEVLFLQGGATLQFAMVPMNLLRSGQCAAYVDSGAWASGAVADAAHYGDIYTAWDGAGCNYTRMPSDDELELRPDTRYLHITSNETIGGVHFARWPEVDAPLVADMSSDYLSRPIAWDRFDLVYGGAQKNLGPSGLAVVFIRKSILADLNDDVARYLRYAVHARERSMFNTPPVFTIYMLGKVLKWVEDNGGVAAMEAKAARKSSLLYTAIDSSDGYYRCPVEVACRSPMNVVFRLPSEALEKKFLDEAAARGMMNLEGHRSVGGVRASIYNAMPEAGARALADFMDAFRADNPA